MKSNESPDPQTKSPQELDVLFRDVSPALEFVCWTIVALVPILRWVNGAAVTHDQFVIQVTLSILALTGAIGLRLYNWRVQSQKR